jgi:cob(I)alamin adenosyltransferase
VPYLNRLSDLLWTLARWLEGAPLPARAPTNEPIEELS